MMIALTGLFLLAGRTPPAASAATAHVQTAPVVKAVLFRADWCANCHVLEPVLRQAMAQAGDLPVQLVVLDFTDPASWDRSVETALDQNVVKTYNTYAGITGLVVLTAADTGERIACFNRTFTAPAMVSAMKAAVARSRTAPRGKRDAGSVFCPRGRAPL